MLDRLVIKVNCHVSQEYKQLSTRELTSMTSQSMNISKVNIPN